MMALLVFFSSHSSPFHNIYENNIRISHCLKQSLIMAANFEATVSARVRDSSKDTYKSKIKQWEDFAKENHPDAWDVATESLILPLPQPFVEEFFGTSYAFHKGTKWSDKKWFRRGEKDFLRGGFSDVAIC
jgi:hypothetical protein